MSAIETKRKKDSIAWTRWIVADMFLMLMLMSKEDPNKQTNVKTVNSVDILGQ